MANYDLIIFIFRMVAVTYWQLIVEERVYLVYGNGNGVIC